MAINWRITEPPEEKWLLVRPIGCGSDASALEAKAFRRTDGSYSHWTTRDGAEHDPGVFDCWAPLPNALRPFFCLTVKRDGGTRDVVGFFQKDELAEATQAAVKFMETSLERGTRRAIVRLEFYDPEASARTTLL